MPGEPGESKEQQEAESLLIRLASLDLGVGLSPKWYVFNDGTRVAVDGASSDSNVLCEAWAHIGRPKTGQKFKVMNDALKLLLVEKLLGGTRRKILVFADRDARTPFTGRSWHSTCLRTFNVETHLVSLPPDTRREILKAQKRQYR